MQSYSVPRGSNMKLWLFHKHIWIEIERQFGKRTPYTPYGYGGNITMITSRCKECGKHRQEELWGQIGKEHSWVTANDLQAGEQCNCVKELADASN